MAEYWQMIKIEGLESDDPGLEICAGIGADTSYSAGSGSNANPISVSGTFSLEKETLDENAESALESYFTDVAAWLLAQQEKVETAYSQWYAGEEIEAVEIEVPPTLDISIQQSWGIAVDAFIWIAKIASKLILFYFFHWLSAKVQRLSQNKSDESKDFVNAFFEVNEQGDKTPFLKMIKDNIGDLSLVDAILDFGGFKVHIVGKALRK